MKHPTRLFQHRSRGLSLVELMVALVLGLVLTFGLTSVYISSKGAFARQEQLSSVQQTVRAAFEYIASDARAVGHWGCYSGNSDAPTQPDIDAATVAGNFAIGATGYEYKNTTPSAYTITSSAPANTKDESNWESDHGTGVDAIPLDTIGGGDGLTPGSDVLVIRGVVGKPLRLTAATGPATPTFSIESVTGGKCSDGTDKVSGFCANDYGLIASCSKARFFQVSAAAVAGGAANVTVTGSTNFNANEYQPSNTEVFQAQTAIYYIKASSNGKTTSLYRRVFDGTAAAGVEQELLEGVENMQVTYGRDTTPAAPDSDGAVDNYVTADQVQAADWAHVVALRVSLVVRANEPADAGASMPASGKVNDVTVTYPTTGTKYDRRVFTTTIAVRNKIGYF